MRFFPLLFFLLFLPGCGEMRPVSVDPIPSAPAADGEGGTATNFPEGGGNFSAPQGIFPHDENWKSSSSHGVYVVRNGRAYCLRCHSLDPAPQVKGGAPACRSCHPLYPHMEGWMRREDHGAFVRREGTANCKTECHGLDLSGGLSVISCHKCHTLYPHSPGWGRVEEHGPAARHDGKRLCKGCHGGDFLGGNSGVSCKNCHPLYPHETGWEEGDKHGGEVMRGGRQICATQCHGPDLRGGRAGVGCDTCHSLYPHEEGWREYEKHGRFVFETLRGDAASCKACHGADLRGGRSGISCFSCHTTYPHPQNWRVPQNHGAAAVGEQKQNCASANCHGDDFAGGTHGPSCFGCHLNFPHTSPRWMTVEPFTRRSLDRDEGFHGDKFIREVNRGDLNACTGCHGPNFDRTLGGISCRGCHPLGVSHLPRQAGRQMIHWRSYSQHGRYFSERFNALSEVPCWKCHGEPAAFDILQTWPDLAAQSECHRCHRAYPHRNFTLGAEWGVHLWEPVVNECGRVDGAAHILYLFNSPLFSAAGQPRPADSTDPSNIPAIQNTCGRNCHAGGSRSFRMQRTITLCTGYCHNPDNPNLPPIPARPACPVLPGGGGGGGDDGWEEE